MVAAGMEGVDRSGALVRESATVAAGAAVSLGNVVGLDELHPANMKEAAITTNVRAYKLGIVLLSPL